MSLPGLKIEAFKSGFFDRDKVLKAVDRAVRKKLNWFGGYVRKAIRNSLKPGSNISAPGQPPRTHITYQRSHVGKNRTKTAPKKQSLYKDTILYAYDDRKQSVIIGPFLLNGGETNPTVPEILEYGGTKQGNGRAIYVKNSTGRDAKGKFVSGGLRKIVMNGAMRYRARPHVRPAFERSVPKLMHEFKDSVR